MATPKKAQDKDLGGRREATIDWNLIGEYIEAGVKQNVIAVKFGLHIDTIRRRCQLDNGISYSDFSRQKKSTGTADLQLAAYRAALSGAYDPKFTGALIFSLKSRLGLSDKPKDDTGSNIVSVTVNKGDESNT